MMSDAMVIGRRMYVFTRPDGTYSVEDPPCCRRVFAETEMINRGASTFREMKHKEPSEVLWEMWMESKRMESDPEYIEHTAENIMNEIDSLILGGADSAHF